jgi:TonB family protein
VRFCMLACFCVLLFAGVHDIQSQQSGGTGNPVGGWHGHPCTEKNPKPDCFPIPHVISSPPPTYSEAARKAKIEGECILTVVVDDKGNTTDIRVVNSLGMGLDEKAIESVKKWKFEPAFGKDGKPASARIAVEVPFHL